MNGPFERGDRVWWKDGSHGEDTGHENPSGTVLCPGNYTLITIDWEFRTDVDDLGLREVPEKELEKIKHGP